MVDTADVEELESCSKSAVAFWQQACFDGRQLHGARLICLGTCTKLVARIYSVAATARRRNAGT